MAKEVKIELSDSRRNPKQKAFIDCATQRDAQRIMVRAGRRGGKTVGTSIIAINRMLQGARVLYAVPTQDQLQAFWRAVCRSLDPAISAGIFRKNETLHTIERAGTDQRIRGKTAWNADSLRGDYADLLILDEYQLMNEDAWGVVGAPMLMDNNGDAIFIYTPPSLRSRSTSKANDPQHAAKMFRRHADDPSGRWKTFHWTSRDNGYISQEAVSELAADMSSLAYRMEIEAEDVSEAPGALWKRADIEANRLPDNRDYELARIVVGVDPTGTVTGDEAGIVAAGRMGNKLLVLEDASLNGSPNQWATAAVNLYHDLQADLIVAEANFGGDMVAHTIHTVDPKVPVKLVSSSRGKAVRAEPIAALYENDPERGKVGRGHHVGSFARLEDEMALWQPGDKSPNRMDALVFAATELMLGFSRAPGDTGLS